MQEGSSITPPSGASNFAVLTMSASSLLVSERWAAAAAGITRPTTSIAMATAIERCIVD
jgi:hypothetical protein